jgi:hypothetical protein
MLPEFGAEVGRGVATTKFLGGSGHGAERGGGAGEVPPFRGRACDGGADHSDVLVYSGGGGGGYVGGWVWVWDWVGVGECMCIYVCLCTLTPTHTNTHKHTHTRDIHIYTYIHILYYILTPGVLVLAWVCFTLCVAVVPVSGLLAPKVLFFLCPTVLLYYLFSWCPANQ